MYNVVYDSYALSRRKRPHGVALSTEQTLCSLSHPCSWSLHNRAASDPKLQKYVQTRTVGEQGRQHASARSKDDSD
jgi:hypothetical protein